MIDLKKLLDDDRQFDNYHDAPLEIQAALSILALDFAMERTLDKLKNLDDRLKQVEKILRHQ